MTKLILEQKPDKMPPENGKSKTTSSKQALPSENIAMASIAGTKVKASIPATADVPTFVNVIPVKKLKRQRLSQFGMIIKPLADCGALTRIKIRGSGLIMLAGKKLSTASDSGVVALTLLASHAKQLGSIVNYRDEDDGMVHEMYVW